MQKEERIPIVLKLLLLLVLFFNNETLSNNLCTFVKQPTQYVSALLIVYFLYYIITHREVLRAFNRNAFILVTLFTIFIPVSYMRDSGFTNGYILLILAVMSAFSLSIMLEFKKFAILFVWYMSALSVISLVCTYILKYMTPFLGGVFKIVTNSAGVSFYNMYACYVYSGKMYYRNFGIFREPGVYAIFLCIAIIFVLLYKEELSRKAFTSILFILIGTLISTFSTTSYIALFMIIIWYGLINRRLEIKHVVAAFLAIILLMWFSDSYVANPLEKLNSDSSSMQYRMETIITGIELMTEKPFGYGILRGINAMSSNYSLKYYHNTSTWVAIGVYLGIPFLLTSFITLLRFCKKRLGSVFLVIPIVLVLSGEMLIYNPFVYILCFYGATYVKNEE